MEYFNRLLDLLQTEQEEDLKLYQQLTENSSAADRRTNGLTWYPIAIRGTEISRGDYITVEVERTTHQDLAHQFRFGMPVVLFSNHDVKNNRTEGLISYQGGNRLKVTLRSDELPDWASDGKLGIDLLFDNNSYDEMKAAVKDAAAAGPDSSSWPLVQVLTGVKKATFNEVLEAHYIPDLNASQQLAAFKVLQANEIAIVHGPPGTGKTTTLVQAIKALIHQEKSQVLVVAPSNTAVDLLSEKLAATGLNVLRIGNPARVSEQLMSLTLEGKMSVHESMKEIKKLKKQAGEFKNMAHKYKRNFGHAEKEQRRALFAEAHKISKEADRTEQYIIDQILSGAQVIAATLVGANHYTIRNRKFPTVVIDEAGQALEPACWIPIMKAQKVVFAGDHCQLPPTVKSNEAAKNGLNITLFEKSVVLQPEAVVLLEEQYRMNKSIMGYSSKVFYHHKLLAHASVANHVLFPEDEPVVFLDTAGCGFEEKQDGTSVVNLEEAIFLIRQLGQFITLYKTKFNEMAPLSIAIISPYKKQVQLLNELLNDDPDLKACAGQISVNTIDSFQGQEKDLVYISLCRSNSEGIIGFLSDTRRMNVAMTRARKKLVVIGDSATLSRSAFYADFITYTEGLNAYHSAWEFIDT